MKVATVAGADRVPRAGVVVGEDFRPFPLGVTVLDLLRAGTLHSTPTGAPEPLAGLRLLPPLEAPTVRDFVTFEQHVTAMAGTVADAWYDAPTFYFTNPYALVGAHDDVAVPPGCTRLDFELEVAAVIGRAGRDLTAAAARDHIAGYTILNDWSARDLQRREMQVHLGPCKGNGPVLVTADELEPYRDADGFLDLELTVALNGVEVGRDRLGRMGWPFEEMVAYASRGTEVRPGDVLGSGTCGNGGCLAELWRTAVAPPPPLAPGDVVTMTVQGIGTISNTVVAGPDPVPLPRPGPGAGDRPVGRAPCLRRPALLTSMTMRGDVFRRSSRSSRQVIARPCTGRRPRTAWSRLAPHPPPTVALVATVVAATLTLGLASPAAPASAAPVASRQAAPGDLDDPGGEAFYTPPNPGRHRLRDQRHQRRPESGLRHRCDRLRGLLPGRDADLRHRPVRGPTLLDAVRAAQRLEPAGLGADNPVVLQGYSQGGGAAAWAGELQPTYASEMKLVGITAGGVPADLTAFGTFLDGSPLFGFLLFAGLGLDAAYPELDLDSYLNDAGRAAFAEAATTVPSTPSRWAARSSPI